MTHIIDTPWDDLVKQVARAERQQLQDDADQFNAICSWLGDYQHEEIEGLEREMQPDGRERGRKLWRDQCAFSFEVRNKKVIVSERGTEPAETFDDLKRACRRMAEHMLHEKQRAWAAERAGAA
jgi:hypothetical protein